MPSEAPHIIWGKVCKLIQPLPSGFLMPDPSADFLHCRRRPPTLQTMQHSCQHQLGKTSGPTNPIFRKHIIGTIGVRFVTWTCSPSNTCSIQDCSWLWNVPHHKVPYHIMSQTVTCMNATSWHAMGWMSWATRLLSLNTDPKIWMQIWVPRSKQHYQILWNPGALCLCLCWERHVYFLNNICWPWSNHHACMYFTTLCGILSCTTVVFEIFYHASH